jgi:hypothetical protein
MEQFEFDGWAQLELMGHRKLVGRVVTLGAVLRIDTWDNDGRDVTQFYGLRSMYALTPITEAAARALGKQLRSEPVSPWDLPAANRQLAIDDRVTVDPDEEF